MKSVAPRVIFPLLIAAATLLPLPQNSFFAQEIPDDLLEDEHVREEFGVNKFTAPSIRKIFEDLQTLRPLPYEELQRTVPEKTPADRTKLALTVGLLLADGFFAVEAEQFFDLEPVGRSLWDHAKVLGAGTKISRHTKSILEHGALNDWEGLKKELAHTQNDVEKEMVLIRDVDAANLISLGGWLRAFEIGCAASMNPYDPKKAQVLVRPDIIEYFALNLETLEPRIKDNKVVGQISQGLDELQKLIDVPAQETLSEEKVKQARILIEGLVDMAYGSKLVAKTGRKASDDTSVVDADQKKPTEAATKPASKKTSTPVKPVQPATGGVVTGEVKN